MNQNILLQTTITLVFVFIYNAKGQVNQNKRYFQIRIAYSIGVIFYDSPLSPITP